jgi:hypothetical protein
MSSISPRIHVLDSFGPLEDSRSNEHVRQFSGLRSKVNECVLVYFKNGHIIAGRRKLRRNLLYSGLVLFLIGLVFVVLGFSVFGTTSLVPVSQSYDQWEVVGNLANGKTYEVYIESNENWSQPFTKGDFTEPMPINVTIVSPGGGLTILQAFIFSFAPTSPMYKEGTPPAVDHVVYQHIDNSSLSVDTSISSKIRFSVKEAGNYTSRVVEQGLWSPTPPSYMIFYEEIIATRQAYTMTVSSGGLLSVIGVVTLLWSAFGKERTKRKRLRK